MANINDIYRADLTVSEKDTESTEKTAAEEEGSTEVELSE